MKTKIYSYLQIAFVVILFASCEKNDYENPQSLIGCWTYSEYSNNAEGKTVISFERASALLEDSDGIEFSKNGSLIERKNAGWCGTPPITYSNYSGEWSMQDENIVINVAYWGGMKHKVWKIIDVTNTTLKIEVLSETNANEIEGTYIGTYTSTNLTRDFSWSSTPTIEFKNGKYSYKDLSNDNYYNTGSGNFTIKDNKILFELTDYDILMEKIGVLEDWLLKGEYEYEIDGDKLTFSKTVVVHEEEYLYKFELKKNE